MEKRPETIHRCSGDAFTPLFPSVPPGTTPVLRRRVTLGDRSCPFLSSIALHALLFWILSIPAVQLPASTKPQTPTVFWLSTFMAPDDNAGAAALLSEPPAVFARQSETREPEIADPATDDRTASQLPNLPPSPAPALEPAGDAEADSGPADTEFIIVRSKQPEHPETRVKTADSTPDPHRSASMPVPAAPRTPAPVTINKLAAPLKPEPQPQRQAERTPATEQPYPPLSGQKDAAADEAMRQNEAERALREIAEQKRLDAEKTQRERIAREQELAANERLAQQHAAAVKARQEQERLKVLQQESLAREAVLRKQREERRASEKPQTAFLAAAKPAARNETPGQAGTAPNEQHPVQSPDKTRGITIPLLKGDLKLLVTAATMPEATITFKEFALSRRNRPFSRNEARNEKKITPQTATNQDSSREIVIEKTTPGVYTITVAPVGGNTEAVFSLEVYGGSPRSITRNLGRHVLAGKKVLCRILMPEGILWQDDKSFTGSMEDSSGVTKFNTETGLMWKEYTD